MPPRSNQQSMKSPRSKVVKAEPITPKAKSSAASSSTTPKSTKSAKSTKSEKTPVASSSSVASSSGITPKSSRKSARKTKTKAEKETTKGILKVSSIRRIAKVHGCERIAADVYDKARTLFDKQMAELMTRAAILTEHSKKKQITFQTINGAAKALWNVHIYAGTNVDDVRDSSKKEDEDYSGEDE